MSIPIKMQVRTDVILENSRWVKIFMLADGSMYAIDRCENVYPVDRSFAGHVLKLERKKRSTSYNNELAKRAENRKELSHYKNVIADIRYFRPYDFEATKAPAENIACLEKTISDRDEIIDYLKADVAEIDKAITKFKGASTKAKRVIDRSKIPANIKNKKKKVVKAKPKDD